MPCYCHDADAVIADATLIFRYDDTPRLLRHSDAFSITLAAMLTLYLIVYYAFYFIYADTSLRLMAATTCHDDAEAAVTLAIID